MTAVTYQGHRWTLSHYETQGGETVAVLVRSTRQYGMRGGHTVEIARYVTVAELAQLERVEAP